LRTGLRFPQYRPGKHDRIWRLFSRSQLPGEIPFPNPAFAIKPTSGTDQFIAHAGLHLGARRLSSIVDPRDLELGSMNGRKPSPCRLHFSQERIAPERRFPGKAVSPNLDAAVGSNQSRINGFPRTPDKIGATRCSNRTEIPRRLPQTCAPSLQHHLNLICIPLRGKTIQRGINLRQRGVQRKFGAVAWVKMKTCRDRRTLRSEEREGTSGSPQTREQRYRCGLAGTREKFAPGGIRWQRIHGSILLPCPAQSVPQSWLPRGEGNSRTPARSRRAPDWPPLAEVDGIQTSIIQMLNLPWLYTRTSQL